MATRIDDDHGGFRNRSTSAVQAICACAGVLVLTVLAPGAWAQTASSSSSSSSSDELRSRLTKEAQEVVLPGRCNECHKSEYQVWARSKHALGFAGDTALHTRSNAKEIYTNLGLSLIKRATDETTPACLQCHYTPLVKRGVLHAGAGVTCESCHGPARAWIDVHNNYGDAAYKAAAAKLGVQNPDFQQAAKFETIAHRVDRIARAREAGMRRPSDLYGVVANCFGCHTVPNEDLVNRGHHGVGGNLEFVAASQGDELRHNFLESFKTGDGKTNAERPLGRKRVMYVVGRAADLEYSLRAAALATVKDRYADAIFDRVSRATDFVSEIVDQVPVPEMEQVIKIRNGVDVRLNNRAALLAAADRIGEQTRKFVASADGTKLTQLDVLFVETPAVASATPASEPAEPARSPNEAPPVSGSGEPSPSTEEAPAAEPSTSSANASAPAVSSGRKYPVQTRPSWRQPPTHRYIASEPCSSCHAPQETWWAKDKHSGTAKAFRANAQKYAEIATRYGISPNDMQKGNQLCMWCHGTVLRNPVLKVTAGVGCQRCHGPGLDYKEPHADEKRARGDRYAESLRKGMTDLTNATARVRTCLGCHHITDPGLLAAGHSDGGEFDVVDRLSKIKHWGSQFGRKTEDAVTSAALAAAQKAVRDQRPVPKVARVAGAPVAPGSSTPSSTAPTPSSPTGGEVAPNVGPTGVVTAPSNPGSVPPPAAGPEIGGQPGQPPRGDLDDPGASIEERLLQLKKRLEELYRHSGS